MPYDFENKHAPALVYLTGEGRGYLKSNVSVHTSYADFDKDQPYRRVDGRYILYGRTWFRGMCFFFL